MRLVAEVAHCLTEYLQRAANASRFARITVSNLQYRWDMVARVFEAPGRHAMWLSRIDPVPVLIISIGVLIGILLIMAA